MSRVAHVLSMRTMLSFMNAKTILLCLATLTFSVLTNCAAKGATLEVLTTREASDSGSSDPSGIDSVKFREDSDGVLSFSQLFYGLDFFCICDGVFWPKCNPDQVFSVHQGLLYGPNALGGGPGAMFMEYMHHGAPNIGFWPHMHALRAWNRDEYRDSLWSRLVGTAPLAGDEEEGGPPVYILRFYMVIVALSALFGGLLGLITTAVHVLAGLTTFAVQAGFAPTCAVGRGVLQKVLASPLLFWLVLFAQVGPTMAVCKVCHGFYSGCDGGSSGFVCKGAATVTSNVAAMAATTTAAITLTGLFDPRVLRVFNTTVLSLIKRYKAMPVAGTPYDFSGKSNSDVVADVIAGKVSKGEALAHFSVKIEEAAALSADDGRAAKTLALETQIKLLGAMDEKPTSSAGAQLMGVHRFVWAKCSEVVLGRDPSKITVGVAVEKESTAAQSAKIHTPKAAVAFLETLNLWSAIVVQTGLAPLMVVFEFTQRVVFLPMRDRNESWMLAHELLLAYLDKVDQSPDRAKNLANVFDKEGVDAMKDEATAAAAARFGKAADIFRHTGGARAGGEEEGKKPYNGKCTPTSPQPCMAWNKNPGNPNHSSRHLHDDGTCKFRHRCGKYIKLASGQIGYCFRDHAMADCDRKPEELSDVAPNAQKRV